MSKSEWANVISMFITAIGKYCGCTCPVTWYNCVTKSKKKQSCKPCREFIGLGHKGRLCPCKALTSSKAYNQTVVAIKRWKNGTHHWQIGESYETGQLQEHMPTYKRGTKVAL